MWLIGRLRFTCINTHSYVWETSFFLIYFFYIHKTDDTSFNVTKNVVLFLIIIIILSIIALIFSIKTSPESVYCIIPVSENTPPPYTTIIKNYVKYFACILKNLIFFIPCLLVIFVSELNKDIKLTPGPVYILFFMTFFNKRLHF